MSNLINFPESLQKLAINLCAQNPLEMFRRFVGGLRFCYCSLPTVFIIISRRISAILFFH